MYKISFDTYSPNKLKSVPKLLHYIAWIEENGFEVIVACFIFTVLKKNFQ